MKKLILTAKEAQKALNDLTVLANALDDYAKREYGSEGMLFFEAEGGFHIMDGDELGTSFSNPGASRRQEHIRLSARGICRMGAGAW